MDYSYNGVVYESVYQRAEAQRQEILQELARRKRIGGKVHITRQHLADACHVSTGHLDAVLHDRRQSLILLDKVAFCLGLDNWYDHQEDLI